MQNAKDTFYEVLRGRLAALNPERTVVVRGVTRPGVLVEENEVVSAVHVPDCFRLRWSGPVTEAKGALVMVTMQCEVEYETAGSAESGGLDRGRCLAAMDAELQAAVHEAPRRALKNNYAALAQGKPVTAMTTSLWWGEVALGKSSVRADRIGRTATVEVMSYQEPGEL